MAKKEGGRKIAKRRVKLICNPGSGNHPDATARLERVVRCLMAHDLEVSVALATPSEQATCITREAMEAGYRIVIAMGGDGTIEATARALVGSKVRLGIIPNGTDNNLARNLGIPFGFEQACAVVAEGHERRIDVGQVRSQGMRHYFFEMAGLGLVADLYPEGKGVQKGKWEEIPGAIGTLLRYPVSKLAVTLDGGSHVEARSMLALITNAPMFGDQYLVCPSAKMDDGYLEICLYPNFSKPELVAYFASIMHGRSSVDERVQRYRAQKIKITADRLIAGIADAEAAGSGEFSIRVLPKALRVMIGPQPGPALLGGREETELPVPLVPTHPPALEFRDGFHAPGGKSRLRDGNIWKAAGVALPAAVLTLTVGAVALKTRSKGRS